MERILKALAVRHEILENDRIVLFRDVKALHGSMKAQKENTDNLLAALRSLIDRIPPENLR